MATFHKDTDDRFIIAGGGVAALQAAKAIRARNDTAHITMVAREKHLPYHRPMLSKAMADGTDIEKLALSPAPFYTENKINLLLGLSVTAVDPCGQKVTLSDGESLPYTGLLLATGANPFNPIKHGHGSIPVHVLRRWEDATTLAAKAPGKKAVVVGGGILGLEAAAALHALGAQVTVVEFAPRIMPLQTDEAVSAMLAEALEKLGIRLLCGTSVAQATGKGALLADGTELVADFILASMGVRSEVELAVAIGLELGRGIVVNEHMHTSRPGIWAAGDCAECGGRVQALASSAGLMGNAAGASMAGDESMPYTPNIPATIFSLGEFTMFSAGNVSGDCAETVLYQHSEKHLYRRLFFVDERLQGVLFSGKNKGAKAMGLLAEQTGLAQALALLQDD